MPKSINSHPWNDAFSTINGESTFVASVEKTYSSLGDAPGKKHKDPTYTASYYAIAADLLTKENEPFATYIYTQLETLSKEHLRQICKKVVQLIDEKDWDAMSPMQRQWEASGFINRIQSCFVHAISATASVDSIPITSALTDALERTDDGTCWIQHLVIDGFHIDYEEQESIWECLSEHSTTIADADKKDCIQLKSQATEIAIFLGGKKLAAVPKTPALERILWLFIEDVFDSDSSYSEMSLEELSNFIEKKTEIPLDLKFWQNENITTVRELTSFFSSKQARYFALDAQKGPEEFLKETLQSVQKLLFEKESNLLDLGYHTHILDEEKITRLLTILVTYPLLYYPECSQTTKNFDYLRSLYLMALDEVLYLDEYLALQKEHFGEKKAEKWNEKSFFSHLSANLLPAFQAYHHAGKKFGPQFPSVQQRRFRELFKIGNFFAASPERIAVHEIFKPLPTKIAVFFSALFLKNKQKDRSYIYSKIQEMFQALLAYQNDPHKSNKHDPSSTTAASLLWRGFFQTLPMQAQVYYPLLRWLDEHPYFQGPLTKIKIEYLCNYSRFWETKDLRGVFNIRTYMEYIEKIGSCLNIKIGKVQYFSDLLWNIGQNTSVVAILQAANKVTRTRERNMKIYAVFYHSLCAAIAKTKDTKLLYVDDTPPVQIYPRSKTHHIFALLYAGSNLQNEALDNFFEKFKKTIFYETTSKQLNYGTGLEHLWVICAFITHYKDSKMFTSFIERITSFLKELTFSLYCIGHPISLRILNAKIDSCDKDKLIIPFLYGGEARDILQDIFEKTSWKNIESNYGDLKELPEHAVGDETVSVAFNHHKFTALPEQLEDCTRLTEIHFDHNAITTIPEWIDKLPNLRVLSLRGNQIKDIPDDVYTWSSKLTIHLEHNNLSEEYLQDIISRAQGPGPKINVNALPYLQKLQMHAAQKVPVAVGIEREAITAKESKPLFAHDPIVKKSDSTATPVEAITEQFSRIKFSAKQENVSDKTMLEHFDFRVERQKESKSLSVPDPIVNRGNPIVRLPLEQFSPIKVSAKQENVSAKTRLEHFGFRVERQKESKPLSVHDPVAKKSYSAATPVEEITNRKEEQERLLPQTDPHAEYHATLLHQWQDRITALRSACSNEDAQAWLTTMAKRIESHIEQDPSFLPQYYTVFEEATDEDKCDDAALYYLVYLWQIVEIAKLNRQESNYLPKVAAIVRRGWILELLRTIANTTLEKKQVRDPLETHLHLISALSDDLNLAFSSKSLQQNSALSSLTPDGIEKAKQEVHENLTQKTEVYLFGNPRTSLFVESLANIDFEAWELQQQTIAMYQDNPEAQPYVLARWRSFIAVRPRFKAILDAFLDGKFDKIDIAPEEPKHCPPFSSEKKLKDDLQKIMRDTASKLKV